MARHTNYYTCWYCLCNHHCHPAATQLLLIIINYLPVVMVIVVAPCSSCGWLTQSQRAAEIQPAELGELLYRASRYMSPHWKKISQLRTDTFCYNSSQT